MYRPIRTLLNYAQTSPRKIGDCDWFRPVSVAAACLEPLDACQEDLLHGLEEAFGRAGHRFAHEPNAETELVIAFTAADEGDGPLSSRIAEPEMPLLVTISDRYKLQHLPKLLIVVTIRDELQRRTQEEMQELGWTSMARLGSYLVLFAKSSDQGPADYYVMSTLEGGHPLIERNGPDCFDQIRDRLITHVCANDVSDHVAAENVIPLNAWKNCRTVDAVVAAGRRLGQLGHFDPPVGLDAFVSPQRQRQLRGFLKWDQQAAGALIAFAPDLRVPGESDGGFTGTCIVTCTGKAEVDKTDLKRDEDLVAVAKRQDRLYAFGTDGLSMKPPSVEGEELAGGMMAAPAVRLSKCSTGYVFDPNGEFVVPKIWAVVHLHRGVEEVNQLVHDESEHPLFIHVLPNFRDFPFAVGCGKDLMFEVSHDAIGRAIGLAGENDSLLAAMFDVPNHGTNFFVFCAPRPGTDIIPEDPFENLFYLLDPQEQGALKLTTEVPQI
jgi:hypothetical protein